MRVEPLLEKMVAGVAMPEGRDYPAEPHPASKVALPAVVVVPAVARHRRRRR